MTNRVMPDKITLGQHHNTMLSFVTHQYEEYIKNRETYPHVMGFRIPEWQRQLVWTKEQKIKLIESIWLGLNIGTFTYNMDYKNDSFDMLLIDGQQRMNAIQCYMEDEFPVFGYKFSEITIVDRRAFDNSHFDSYQLVGSSVEFMKNYYNIMNFGGTQHKESERA